MGPVRRRRPFDHELLDPTRPVRSPMRSALLAFLAGLLAFAPLAAAQAEGVADPGWMGPVPWPVEDAAAGLDAGTLGVDPGLPSPAPEDLADALAGEAGMQALQPPNAAVIPPSVGGLVPRFCIIDNTVAPLGGCFVSGIGPHPTPPSDNGSGEPPADASADATGALILEEAAHAPRDNASAADAAGAGPASPSDPFPTPSPSKGGAPSHPAPTSLRQAPAPGGSLAWELATAAVALPGALLAKLASILVLRRRGRGASPTMRETVLEAIAARPGVRHRELVRRVGRGNGTVEHHVRALLAEGRIVRLRVGASTAYALAGDLSPGEARLRLALAGRTSRSLALDVAAHPGTRLTEVAVRVGVSLATAHYQAGKLVAAGILRDLAGAGGRRLEPTPAGRACLAAVMADGPAVAVPFGAQVAPMRSASSAT